MDNKSMEFISFAVTPEEKATIKRVAKNEQRDVSKLIRVALDTWAEVNGLPPFFAADSGNYSLQYETESDNR